MTFSAVDGNREAKEMADELGEIFLREGKFHRLQYNVGSAYLDGRGTRKNYPAAIQWLEMAAEGGVTDAQFNLGIVYRDGGGVTRNLARSYYWLRRAASDGDIEAERIAVAVRARMTEDELLASALGG